MPAIIALPVSDAGLNKRKGEIQMNKRMKRNLLNIPAFLLAMAVWILFMAMGMNVNAEENSLIPVRVKATVPEDFVEPVSIKYEGKNIKNNTIDIVLDYAHEYSTDIMVLKDLYTLKYDNTSQGYEVGCSEAFTVENADPSNTYWLPITVNAGTVSFSGSKEDNDLLNLLIRANFDTDTEDYEENISLKYSGTHGNLFVANLNRDNGYSTTVQIIKDIYTKESVSVAEGYYCSAQYSFNLENANTNSNYLLDITVRKGEDPEKQKEYVDVEKVVMAEESEDTITEIESVAESEEKETGLQDVVIEIPDFDKADLTGNVYVSYAGENNVIEAELNQANEYSYTIQAEYDRYELLYITYYDDDSISFEASYETLIVDGSTTLLPVRIFVKDQKGRVLNNEKDKSRADLILGILFIVLCIGIYIGYKKIKKKGEGKRIDKEEKDEFDSSIYMDDDDTDDMDMDFEDDDGDVL